MGVIENELCSGCGLKSPFTTTIGGLEEGELGVWVGAFERGGFPGLTTRARFSKVPKLFE